MAEPFIGEIRPVPYNFAPRSWAFCEGQLLAIAQNNALFSLLGTTFGGDGRTTFGLPDLRGRVPLGEGTGPGLTQRRLGARSGNESVTLQQTTIPAHNHAVNVSVQSADAFDPASNLPADSPRQVYAPTKTGSFASDALTDTGDGESHGNRQPLLVISYIIALQGIFPSRN